MLSAQCLRQKLIYIENNLGNRLEAIGHDINNDNANELSYGYAYDQVGNVVTKTIDDANELHYGYDNIYQLLTGDYPAGWVYADETFSFDALGNRDQSMGYSANRLNQYTSVNSVSYGYDDNGNLTADGTYTYEYDPENRLLVVKLSGSPVATYGYDALGHRVSKTVGAVITRYCYDGNQVIAEYDPGAPGLLRKFIYGPGIDEPICMIVPGSPEVTYFYHQDALGSVVALSKFNTSLGYAEFVEKYSYSAFGETTVTQGGTSGNPYRFTGREYEPETGLYYYRARFYSPAIGRFLQTDPIGYTDSMNLYQYCGNNPLRFIDPYGLKFIRPYDPKARAAFDEAIAYLSKSEVFQDVYNTLERSDWEFDIQAFDTVERSRPLLDTTSFSSVGYPGSSIITWKYDLAAIVNGGVQSPALGLAHEMIHAFRWWRDESMPISINPKSKWGEWGSIEERETILGLEGIIAKQLGEPQRFYYSDKTMKVSGPTKRCK